MTAQPQIQMEGFSSIVLNSALSVNGDAPRQLNWKADEAGWSASTPEGSWKLLLTEKSGRMDAALSGTLNKPADRLELTLFSVPEFEADHVLPQAVRMGGCQAYDLTRIDKEASFTGELLLSITKNGRTLQCSTPFHGGFSALFRGTAHSGGIRDLQVVFPVEFYGGTEIAFPVLSFRSSADGFSLMESYADENCDVKKTFDTPPSAGWNSWDYYRWTITEEEVLRNAEFIAKDPVLSRHVKRIIVDDGWQYCYGEWEANSCFPSGMEFLAKELTRMGFEPGLWFAPAIAEPHSRIAQLDYDMLARSAGGQPCLAYECMRRFGFVLDPTVRKTEEFMEKITLMADVDNHDETQDAVVLMTMHSAKGLEFPVVFLPGLEDGLFPGHKAFDSPSGMEEERRLCYVGMTRAKEMLILCSAAMRTLYGRTDYTRESQFLREIDKRLLEGDAVYERKRRDSGLGVSTGSFDGFAAKESPKPFDALRFAKAATRANAAAAAAGEELEVGDRVRHAKFGEGLVIDRDERTLTVIFDSAGQKKMAKGIAPLKKI